jgi:hypothetical protein
MFPPGVQPAGAFAGAQHAAPFLFVITGSLNPHPLLGGPGGASDARFEVY